MIRPGTSGYGLVYLIKEMLETKGDSLTEKVVTTSGFGNVALFTCEKVTSFGAKVVTVSDSSGYVYDKDGIDLEKLAFLMDLNFARRGRIAEYAIKYHSVTFYNGKKTRKVKCDVALPSATQNELDGDDAKTLVSNGVVTVGEGANMSSTLEAIEHFL